MFNYVFYMPSSLPLLYTAMPTRMLFAIVIPTSLYIFRKRFFCLVFILVEGEGVMGVSWYDHYWFPQEGIK